MRRLASAEHGVEVRGVHPHNRFAAQVDRAAKAILLGRAARGLVAGVDVEVACAITVVRDDQVIMERVNSVVVAKPTVGDAVHVEDWGAVVYARRKRGQVGHSALFSVSGDEAKSFACKKAPNWILVLGPEGNASAFVPFDEAETPLEACAAPSDALHTRLEACAP